MLRTPLISPLLLLLAQRTRVRLAQDADDPWHALQGLRRESLDPDRTLDHWTQAWPALTQQSLAHARAHPLLHPQLQAIPAIAQPATLAQALLKLGPLPEDGHRMGDAWLLPWAGSETGYPPALLDRMCQGREAGQQVWLVVDAADSEAAAREDRIETALRLGVAWFLRPPNDTTAPTFEQGLRAWTRIVLQNPQHDQWVGLWAELIERVMLDLAQCGQVSRRSAAPEGWPKCAQAHWMAWTRTVLDTWREVWPGPAQLEDVCIGLLQGETATLLAEV